MKRGYTLAEGLVSLFLTILTLAMIGGLMSRISSSSRSSAQREARNQLLSSVLQQIAIDCRKANVWHTPAVSQWSGVNRLELEQPSPGLPQGPAGSDADNLRYPPSPSGNHPVWQAVQPNPPSQLRVSLQVQQNQLIRRWSGPWGSRQLIMLDQAQRISIQRMAVDIVAVELLLEDGTALRREVVLPMRRCWGTP